MHRPKVLVTHYDVPEAGLNLLRQKCDVIINHERPLATREQILAKVAGVDALYWVSPHRVDKEVLNVAGPQLKVVATISSGVDHLDIKEIKSRNIKVGHLKMIGENTVADLAILLALAASRRLHEGRQNIENGTWRFGIQWMLGQDIYGSTVGLVGFGNIGQAIAKKLRCFDVARILYCGNSKKEQAKTLLAEYVTFDELLRESDFVIVACPLNSKTENMFNDAVFKKMKRSAVFVNVGRGGIVDQSALIRALKDGTIFAAGLDVMTPEPLPVDDELLTLSNCVLLPHLGNATVKTRSDMAEFTAINIINALEGKEMLASI